MHRDLDRDRFWQRVQGCLDERTDPVDDPGVQAYLLQHPEALEEFAALTSRVRDIEAAASQPMARARPRRWGRVWVMAGGAGVLLLGVVVWPLLLRGTVEVALPDVDESGQVWDFSARRYTVREFGSREHTMQSGTFAVTEKSTERREIPAALSGSRYPIELTEVRIRTRARKNVMEDVQ